MVFPHGAILRAGHPRGHFLCAGALLDSHLLGIGPPFWTRSHSKLPLGAQGAPNGSRSELKGDQNDAKEGPLGAQGAPRLPKESPKSPQGEQRELQRQSTETNKSQNYIHIDEIHANSRSTAIQRPTNNIYIYIYISAGPSLEGATRLRRGCPVQQDLLCY